ncbi:MAG: hypothetical protein NC201_01005 [Prevotella sp.]|nr:hypothetical protein [Bacteroides sp.]MCM1365805.1 hypothetical protein [Prevotella sp.]MCM1436503.1 hypothetical protein [Prevotella sp.]
MIEKKYVITSDGTPSLEDILTQYVSKLYDSNYHLIIELADVARYTLDRRFNLRCNLTIKGRVGRNGEKSELYYKKSAFPDNEVKNWDDGFLSVQGETEGQSDSENSNRLYARIENISVRLENKTYYGAPQQAELLLLKFRGCFEIKIFNVDTYLSNGPITNLDIRESDNVEVTGCHFENTNGRINQQGKIDCTAGGVLWLRGGCKNVYIHGNYFYKNGNDELLAIWTGSRQHNYEVENVEISDNRLEYGLEISDTNNNYANDVLVAFYSDSGLKDKFHSNWRNFNFARNIIICRTLVRRVIWITTYRGDDFKNFIIQDNSISHLNYISTFDNDFVEDIEFRVLPSSLEGGDNEGLVIRGNNFVAGEHITNSLLHRNVINNGGNVIFDNNFVDTRNQRTTLSAKETVDGGIVLTIGGDKTSFIVRNNEILGNSKFAHSLFTSVKYQDIVFHSVGNNVTGSSELYFQKIYRFDCIIKGNVFTDTGYHVLLIQAPEYGRLIVSDNVYTRQYVLTESGSVNNSGTLYADYEMNPIIPKFSYVTICNNTFIGYNDSLLTSIYKTGETVTVKNNIVVAVNKKDIF